MLGATHSFHILKELNDGSLFYSRHTLKILFSLEVLQMVTRRTTAAVTIAIRKQKCIQTTFLDTLFPSFTDFFRVCKIGIAGWQEGDNFRTVSALPREIVIRKLVTFIVGPKDLLRYQVFDSATFQDLRKRS